jgi:hypothetical protein
MLRKTTRGPIQIIADFKDGKLTEEDAVKAIRNLLKRGGGCVACYVLERDYMEMVDKRDAAFETCAGIAENWNPELPPQFINLRLQAEAEQLDAKLRPIQLEVAKKIAQAIRKEIE